MSRSARAWARAPPRSIIVLPALFEGEAEGGDRTGQLRRVQRDPAGLPGPADGIDRHRAVDHRPPTCGPKASWNSRSC
ncbi:hypothetical protein ACRAWD_28850 [Caulobacter segnis]